MATIERFSPRALGALARLSEGVYAILPYGKLVLNRLARVVTRAMNKLRIKEVLMPCAVSAAVFANRLKTNPELFVATTNHMVLAPTAEDIVLCLPNVLSIGKLYQIQTKFRNELRSSPSLIRGSEFIMKDCYMLFKSKRLLLTEFRLMMTEYKLMFRTFGVRFVVAVGDASALSASHSLEFVVFNKTTTNTSCWVHAHALAVTPARYLSFTDEYVTLNKVLINSAYLRLAGLELAHTFVFSKTPRLNAWLSSFGIGLSRLLGHTLKSATKNLDLTTVCNSVVLNVGAGGARHSAYSRYVYCVLRCTALSCVLFKTKAHVSVLLGVLRRLPPKLILFVNMPLYGFFVSAVIQKPLLRDFRRVLSVQDTLLLAHAINSARVC